MTGNGKMLIKTPILPSEKVSDTVKEASVQYGNSFTYTPKPFIHTIPPIIDGFSKAIEMETTQNSQSHLSKIMILRSVPMAIAW